MSTRAAINDAGLLVELAEINQARAQGLLTDITFGERAPAMLLTWNDVIASADDLWDALPPATGPAQLLMQRLSDMATPMHAALNTRRWPESTQADDRLLSIADTYTRAADLIHAERVRPTPEQADGIRAAVTATIHFSAHSVRGAATAYVAEALTQVPDVAQPHRRPNRDLIKEAADRMLGMEQLSATAAGGLYGPQPTDAARTSEDRALAASFAEWDVQSHRTLARNPNTANLYLIARTQAAIGQVASTLLRARATTAHLKLDDYATRVVAPSTTPPLPGGTSPSSGEAC
jgi:hypothetical protein